MCIRFALLLSLVGCATLPRTLNAGDESPVLSDEAAARSARDTIHAQYKLGKDLFRAGSYDSAIAELKKLFPTDSPNYYGHLAARHISYCYGAKGDFVTALEWALLARDKYPFLAGCGTCRA